MVSEIINKIIDNQEYSPDNLICLLEAKDNDLLLLFKASQEIKEKYVKKITYFRGLVEFSNTCHKNCLYCGIRASNQNVIRYSLTDDEILDAAKFAWKNKYGSIVLQSGEITTNQFINRIDNLLKKIHQSTNAEMKVTLSLGEQTNETYKKWFESGAHRYLLRIETSNPQLYAKIHPNDKNHQFEKRIEALSLLQKIGYQTGTGVMIGLPFQTILDLANDLLFMKKFSIDMVGMGPYVEHRDTPLYEFKNCLLPVNERFNLTLKMIAILRIMMKDINIAAATALQAIDKVGREKAINIGANIIMPNITPGKYRDSYKLYENKPCTDENAEDCSSCLEARIAMAGDTIGYSKSGDSQHFKKRKEQ